MAPDPSPQRTTAKGKRWDLVRVYAAQERMAPDPSPQRTTAKGKRWDLVRLYAAQERMAPDPSLQRITFKGGRWDTVRTRLHAAQERHSFITTSSRESSTQVDAPLEEKKQHWSTVSQTVRFGSHFAKRRSSRRGISVTIAPEGSSMRWSSVRVAVFSSRRGTSNASTPVAASSRKQVLPGALTVQEESTDTPHWKQKWLRRKNAMEEGGARSTTAALERQPTQAPLKRHATGLVCTRHGARNRIAKYGGGVYLPNGLAPDDSSQPKSHAGLAGLTAYYKFMKAKYPNAPAASSPSSPSSAAAFSPCSSTASSAAAAAALSVASTPTSKGAGTQQPRSDIFGLACASGLGLCGRALPKRVLNAALQTPLTDSLFDSRAAGYRAAYSAAAGAVL
ncbi:hypothetical protein T484DRAFT_1854565 [Baffinella frigidus]|nr:hypothetical protein T484DRAFT_1854565 [Cryptophyta sp. CCMP2293]